MIRRAHASSRRPRISGACSGWRARGVPAILAGMSTTMLVNDPRVYTFERGQFIAEAYSEGECTLRELARLHPDRVPAPFWVYRWRRDYPAFELLMQDAERVRAGIMADDLPAIAADAAGTAADNRNKMAARQWLAERYDRQRFGKVSTVHNEHTGSVAIDVPALSDEQLAIIAASGRPALEGVAERVAERGAGVLEPARAPTPPAAPGAPGGLCYPSDPSVSLSYPGPSPVDSNELEAFED